jgi:hypothetical protein
VQTFPTGYRLNREDLTVQFVKKFGFGHGPLAVYNPFYVACEIGLIDSNLAYTRIGPEFRVPEIVKVGTYRANFIVGEHWVSGIYQIIWKYQVCAEDPIQTAVEQFAVAAAYAGSSTGLTVTV